MDAATAEHVISQVGRVLEAETACQNHKMSLADIKARLSHIAGIDGLKVEPRANGGETYRLGDRSVNVPAGNAGVRSRVSIIAAGLENRPSVEAIESVDRAVAKLSDPITEQVQVHKEITGRRMTTIAEQLKAARAQLQDARQGAADAVTKSADASQVVLGEVNKVLKEAADLRAEVAELTNGGLA